MRQLTATQAIMEYFLPKPTMTELKTFKQTDPAGYAEIGRLACIELSAELVVK